jgi:cellobiose phosphorylase
LRYAQALAHMGEAERFYRALCQMVPIGIDEIVPSAARRQVNCYYSSSDAAFADRYQASAEYERVRGGDIALEGGWRVYSSGAGIGYALVIRRLLGVTLEAAAINFDPVMPASFDGLAVDFQLCGQPVRITYEVRTPGSGVSSLELNGVPLPLTYAANPYRRGAAEVRRDFMVAQLSADGNRLMIRVGG